MCLDGLCESLEGYLGESSVRSVIYDSESERKESQGYSRRSS